MTAKKINELSVKTPVSTDLIPVADPTTGVAGKSTLSQITGVATVQDTYTGSWLYPFKYIIGATKTIGQSGQSPSSIGLFVEKFNYNEYSIPNGLTSLTHSNINTLGNYTANELSSLTSLSFPVLTNVLDNFQPGSMPFLTTLSLPSLVMVQGNFSPNNMESLTALNLPLLERVYNNFNPSLMKSVTTISTPELVSCGSFSPQEFAFTTLTAPKLAIVHGNFWPQTHSALTTITMPALTAIGGSFQLGNNPLMTTLSFPVLERVGDFSFFSCNGLVSLTMPALKYIGRKFTTATTALGQISTNTSSSFTTLILPVIETIGRNSSGVSIATNSVPSFSTFTLGSTLRQVDGNVTITSGALTQASVDGLLVRLAALDGTGVTTAYSTKTVTITGTSATPSATGLAAKATLVARGCTVTHN
jgi:hypothetical protein